MLGKRKMMNDTFPSFLHLYMDEKNVEKSSVRRVVPIFSLIYR